MDNECELCIKRKTMFCPNSNECYETKEKPFYQNRIMLLKENQQLKAKITELGLELEDRAYEQLKQKNYQLKDDNFKLQARADKYKCRIDKAIEYIKRAEIKDGNSKDHSLYVPNILEILKGDNNE